MAGAAATLAARCAPRPEPSGATGPSARVALVIGNGDYGGGVPTLPNPPRDARAMAASLRRLGFQVDLLTDGSRDAMEAAVRRLADSSANAEAAVVFYAGHAAEVGGSNLLFPTSIKLDTAELQRDALSLDAVLQAVAGRARSTLVFLDSCRDNPFAGKPVTVRAEPGRQADGATRSVGNGLAPVSSTVRTLIAFSTAPGRVALDGGGQNSPFTAALLKYIGTPDIDVRGMLSRVRRTVREETNGQQVPWDNSSLERGFSFSNSVASPLLREAVAYASAGRIPVPDLKSETIQEERASSRTSLAGVWVGAYASGRQVLVVVFSVDEAGKRADVLYAEGPSTSLSRVPSPGSYFRNITDFTNGGLSVKKANGWSYRFGRWSDDEIELASIRGSGETDATTRLRRVRGSGE